MRNLLFLLLSVGLLVFTACRGGKTSSTAVPSYAKTEITWAGATAEQLKNLIMVMPTLRMAIVWDEKALIYHEGSEDAVTTELAKAQSAWPAEGPVLGETLWIDGMLPEPPPPVEEPKLQFEINSEKIATLGITASDVAKNLRDLNLSLEGLNNLTASKSQLADQTILKPDGTAIPLADVVDIILPDVWRPLVIDHR